MTRTALRAGTVSAGTALMVMIASPSFAFSNDPTSTDPPLSVGEIIGLYVGIPVVVFGVIALLVSIPYLRKGTPSDPGVLVARSQEKAREAATTATGPRAETTSGHAAH